MMREYEKLLVELGISLDESSYEISRQLGKNREEQKNLITSRNDLKENQRIQQKIDTITVAKIYFEELAKKEEENETDTFDYASLKITTHGNSSKQDIKEDTTSAENSDLQVEEKELTFEERYDNILRYMENPDNIEDGLRQLEQLAQEGYVLAQIKAGEIYSCVNKRATDANVYQKKALYWYEKAVENGSMSAYYGIINIYLDEKENTEAFLWMKKLAEMGDKAIYSYVAYWYATGIGTDKNIDEAIKWYEKAAENEDEDAYWKLGCLYAKRGKLKDERKAFFWMKKAAEAGKIEAANYVGYHYQYRKDNEKNLTEAVKWYEKAAENGVVEACWNLGCLYRQEEEFEDNRKAFYWYKKAAELGMASACDVVGSMYRYGEGTRRDLTQAIKWYEKAAEQEDVEAYHDLALLYRDEEEVNDYRKALYWLEKTADTGDANAMCEIGIIYQNIYHNRSEALQWYEKAVQGGNQLAQSLLKDLSKKRGFMKWFK